MVLRQVGERNHVEDRPIDSAHLHGVAGDLDGDPGDSPVDQPPENTLHCACLGGSTRRRSGPIGLGVADGPDDFHVTVGSPCHRSQHVGHGCLPVGTGDADRAELCGWVIVHLGSHPTQRGSTLLEKKVWYLDGRRLFDRDRNCTSGNGLFDKSVPIRPRPPNRGVERTRADMPTIHVDIAHGNILSDSAHALASANCSGDFGKGAGSRVTIGHRERLPTLVAQSRRRGQTPEPPRPRPDAARPDDRPP